MVAEWKKKSFARVCKKECIEGQPLNLWCLSDFYDFSILAKAVLPNQYGLANHWNTTEIVFLFKGT